jgi:integrase
MTKLTAPAIEKLKARDDRYEVAEAGTGLRVVVQPSGIKSFAVRFRRPNGKSAKLTLGTFDPATRPPVETPEIGGLLLLSEARVLVAEVQRQRAAGRDPAADFKSLKRQAKAAAIKAEEATFEVFARRYIERHAKPNTRRWTETARTLGLDADDDALPIIKGGIADRWRGRAAASITKADVVAEIDRATDRAPTAGNKVKAALSEMFRWHARRGALDTVPTALVDAPVPLKKLRRSRRLSDAELRALWRALDECVAEDEVPQTYASMLQFTLLTSVRRDEAREMLAREVGADGKNWIVPGARTKNHLDHLVPLSSQAREVLREVPRIAGKPGYVFTLNGSTPLGNLSRWKNKVHARMEKLLGAKIEQWHIHDFRRCARSYLSRVASVDIAERVLGHVKDGLRATYDLHQYEKEKRDALALWAREVERIVAGKSAKVLPLRRGA